MVNTQAVAVEIEKALSHIVLTARTRDYIASSGCAWNLEHCPLRGGLGQSIEIVAIGRAMGKQFSADCQS